MALPKMFNVKRFLNEDAAERFAPMIETVIRDMTDEELSSAHLALSIVDGMLTAERVRRDEAGEIRDDWTPDPYCGCRRCSESKGEGSFGPYTHHISPPVMPVERT